MPKVLDMAIGCEALATVRQLGAHWFSGGAEVAPLRTAGFSGAPVFLIRPADAPPHVLKGFSVGTTRPRAEWVHAIANGLRRAGAQAIPAIREHAPGDTLVTTGDGRLWEMVAYVDGSPVDDPSPSQIASAMRTLAGLHTAATTLPQGPPERAPSRAVTERIARAHGLCEQSWRERLDSATTCSRWHSILMPRLATACDAFDAGSGAASLTALAACSPRPLPCQVVLRDVWSEHVLFDHRDHGNPDTVAGIIDLHAAGIDTPATDIARLLGSWMPSDARLGPSWWASAIASYEAVRPLDDMERRLVPLLAASGIVFGLDNWFRWTLIEDRVFTDESHVVSRVDRLVKSLPTALKVMIDTMPNAGLTPQNSSP